jgi:hypothetical protein
MVDGGIDAGAAGRFAAEIAQRGRYVIPAVVTGDSRSPSS